MNEECSLSEINEDLISSSTPGEAIVSALARRGCSDITAEVDLAACSKFPLAGGGFCDVYQGSTTRGDKIAIKCLRLYLKHGKDTEKLKGLKRAARELYHWSKLKHPNVLPLMGLAMFRGHLSMVSEWMEHGCLMAYLSVNAGMDRIGLCLDICLGLSHIHVNDMVHGDLKAANVVVSRDGTAMIADFGNSQLKDLTLKFTDTTSSSLSVRWAAPELLDGDDDPQVTKESDVYAYGMTVLETLTGNVPFEGIGERKVLTLVALKRQTPARPAAGNERLDIAGVEKLIGDVYNQPCIKAKEPGNAGCDHSRVHMLTDIHITKRVGAAKSDESDSKENKRGVEQPLSESNNQGLETALTESPRAGNDPMLGGLVGRRLLHEPRRKVHESSTLGVSLHGECKSTGRTTDVDRAIELQTEIVPPTLDDHQDIPKKLNNLGVSYRSRFERLNRLPDLDKAVEFQAQAVSLTPDDHADKPRYLNDLGSSYMRRFERLGGLPDLDQAIDFQAHAVLLAPDSHPDQLAILTNLGVSYMERFERLRTVWDLDKVIESQTRAILLAPNDHPDRPTILNNLGSSYNSRFEHLGGVSDLSKAIEFQAHAVSLTPDDHVGKAAILSNLGSSYRSRFERLGQVSDLQSARLYFKRASELIKGPPSVRFRACRRWAELSLFDPTSSPMPAYQEGISLIPQLVWVGSTISHRYELIAEASEFAAEAASHAISASAYYLALEWLEAGRSIVWGQITLLRTPFEKLSSHNPKLAEALASAARQLEDAGSRLSLRTYHKTNNLDLVQEADSHIQLDLKWDKLLKEVRSMPGFDDFLRSPTAGRLMSAAKAHPIAILNLHDSRCDALILQPGTDTISHIALPNFCLEDAISTCRLVFSRMRDRRSGQSPPLGRLQSSLEHLWSGVVKPVLDFLGYTRQLPVEQLPRLTWCTTGLLSFLPLHTARSQDESHLSAFDLVISSYTPTLGTLLSSQSAGPSSACGVVAIGRENTPGLTSPPCTARELAAIHKHTQSTCYMQLEHDEATVEQVLDAMDQFSWVHMACHGSQGTADPTQSAFHLHDGNLTLAAITKQSFANKGLAFLSACQTATGDQKMPDGVVHLAAGMLMAGYPSVIGTMWSIADEDGPEVADLVYAELLKDGRMDHTNSARALHRAVAHLRTKVGDKNIARWAPFIHIGA